MNSRTTYKIGLHLFMGDRYIDRYIKKDTDRHPYSLSSVVYIVIITFSKICYHNNRISHESDQNE